jgi:hypothetical protein
MSRSGTSGACIDTWLGPCLSLYGTSYADLYTVNPLDEVSPVTKDVLAVSQRTLWAFYHIGNQLVMKILSGD